MAAPVKALPDEEKAYYGPLLSRLEPKEFTVEAIDGKGKGLKTATGFRPAEVLFMEEPLVSHQFFDNKHLVQTCDHCHRFIGDLHSQLNKLATVTIPAHEAAGISGEEIKTLEDTYEKAFPPLPSAFVLPAIDAEAALIAPVVPCAFGCDAEYCSEACRDKAARQYHLLMCPAFEEGREIADAPAKTALSSLKHQPIRKAAGPSDDAEGESSDDDHDEEDDGQEINAAILLRHQCLVANEMLLFAAKVIGRVIEGWVKNGNDIEKALIPFMVLHSAPWWTIFALREMGEEEKRKAEEEGDEAEDEDGDEVKPLGGAGIGEDSDVAPASLDEHSDWAKQTKSDLTEYMLDNLVILRALTKARVPHIVKFITRGAEGVSSKEQLQEWEYDMLFDAGLYERLIAALELNSLEIKIDSPLRDYIEALREAPKGKTSPYHQAAAAILPVISQLRAARSARKALQKLLEAAAMADADEEADEHDSDEEDSESEEEEPEGDDFMTDAEVEKLFPLSEGSAVFALISCMNHHCEPNVQVAYAKGDRTAALIAMKEIKAGEELNINYVDIEQRARSRRADLKHYGFHCRCHRCVNEDEEDDSDEK